MVNKESVVVVTGAANGIGREIVKLYGELGANVILVDQDRKGGEEAAATLKDAGVNALFIEGDVGEEATALHVMDVIRGQFGHLDILINNAGVSAFVPLLEMTTEQWDRIIHSNLRSVFLFAREGSKLMEENGCIINIASTRAFQSEPDSEAYAATKGGIIALTHALSASLAEKRIRVNAVSPGWIETKEYEELREKDHEQHFSKRVGTPADIARLCLFLSDSRNNFINGENIIVDGGMTKKMIYE
ncbi:3-ketoacyl-ACP reductase [Pradoshia eiseniae]|uniref:3-ketoacyl-ACP reductase n=1 Tax=Pradoshia eiseniae TaxID=2064768 RepID=A0A2S7MYZ2_9BACI|nr:SDR family oxidoreductase [Pradoshia eiseniae]PQD94989.1 3-ketoacyl-ACP reductase [Pradoshia eiseniae]